VSTSRKKRLFARGTTIDVPKSRAAIERMLTEEGATSFASGWQNNTATILFECSGRRIRFALEMVPIVGNDPKAEAENRRRWRCLVLVIKAKFESVSSGITAFEDEFLANTVIPGGNGETVSQWVGPQLAAAYERGVAMPKVKMLGDGR
jgi:hypothetical protein